MASWILFLFPLYGVLRAEDSQLTSVDCCNDGRGRGMSTTDCTVLPIISSFHHCRLVQRKCCEAMVIEKSCNTGVTLALRQGGCERHFLTPGEQNPVCMSCCHCCLLGLNEAELNADCELPGLKLTSQCKEVAKRCCRTHTDALAETMGVAATTRPQEGNVTCGGSTCAHRCVGNGTCGCNDGYGLQEDGVSCEDINECLHGSHNCTKGEECINAEGSFHCQSNTSCGKGYELQDHYCQDINECVSEASPCPTYQTCINTLGSYTCSRNSLGCRRGYHLNAEGTRCEDIDECSQGSICGNYSCLNLVGSFRCQCPTGFIFNAFSRRCEDIDECLHDTGNRCDHMCENTEGSYKCHCATGYTLSVDQRSCEDIDECALLTGEEMCSYRCYNTEGSFYCTCPPTGYTLAADGLTCLDIDECALGSHTCSATESCFNIHGGFRCQTFHCPANYQEIDKGDDLALSLRCSKACQSGDSLCLQNLILLISHINLALPTFSHFTEPEDLVFLRTNAVAEPGLRPSGTYVKFEMKVEDQFRFHFDVETRYNNGFILGVVRQVRPIRGPTSLELDVRTKNMKSGLCTHISQVIIHIIVSEFSF